MKNKLLPFLLFTILSSTAMAAYTPPPYSVTSPPYNAKCNGRQLITASTTASSGVISSSAFVAGDVGKQIAVYAGTPVSTTGNTHTSITIDTLGTVSGVAIGQIVIGSGVPSGTYVTAVYASSVQLSKPTTSTLSGTSIKFVPFINDTIASVSSGVSATLTTNTAGITISGSAIVNYGTDDAAAINSAVTAATAAGGGTLILPESQCVIASPIVVKDKISIVGYGQNKSAIKWLSTSSMGTGFEGAIAGVTGSTASPYRDNLFADFEIDMDNSFASTYQYYEKCIDITYMVRPTFRNLYMHGSIATCLGIDYIEEGQFINNVIENAGRGQTTLAQDGDAIAFELSAGYLPNAENSIVSGNILINPHHYGIRLEGFLQQSNIQSIITNNIIETNQNNSIGISDNGATGAIIANNSMINTAPVPIGNGIESSNFFNTYIGVNGRIENNYVDGFSNGIALNDANGVTQPNKYSVVNNTVLNSAKYGISLSLFGSVTSNNNIINGNLVQGSQQSGIAITTNSGTPTVTNLVLNGNILRDNGQTASSDSRKSGIYTNVTITGLTMQNNTAWDSGSGYEKYGFTVETGITVSNAMDSDNNFIGVSSSPENILGTYTGMGPVNNNGQSSIYNISQAVKPTTLAISTATFTPIFSGSGSSNNFNITLVHASCPCTLANPTGTILPGQSGQIIVNQSATGSDLINTYGGFYKFAGATAPTLSTGASAVDVLPYYVIDATHIVIGAGPLNVH